MEKLLLFFFFWLLQQIDEMLAGVLTQEDEDAVLAELEAITQVGHQIESFIDSFITDTCRAEGC